MSARPQVVFCTDGIFPHAIGGMQRFARLLIESLATAGQIEIVVIHPHRDVRIFEAFPEVKELYVDPLPGKRNYLTELYVYSKQVFTLLKDYPKAWIYSQGLSVWYKAGTLRKRLIIHPHGLEPFQVLTRKEKLKTFPLRITLAWLFNKAGRVISLGGKLTGIIQSHILRKDTQVVVIPNATLIPAEFAKAPAGENTIRCLFVGRFAYNKGIDVLMAAITNLGEAASKFHFTLAGKGELYEAYRERYAAENIDFLGFVTDEQLSQLYKTQDLFVLPTRFEGMPTVVLEAMAHQMPVIVSDVGASAELVDAQNGYLIPPGSESALTEALLHFAGQTPEARQQLGTNSLRRVEESYTWPQVAAAHLKLFT
ncbi:MAG: glycosyltransferase family 1 protein [Bacteroidetes bacterium]|nr:MAG: glycosyltransferase family 1 protein [Bacteroidota bacterium]